MSLLLSALAIGYILSLLALGVYIALRVFDFPDITVDGTLTLGAAVAAVLLVRKADPLAATLAGGVAAAVAGTITGILHTRLRIDRLLSGILVMTGLYSVNLRIMGRSNVPLVNVDNLATRAGDGLSKLLGGAKTVTVLGWEVGARDVAVLVGAAIVVPLIALAVYCFLRTSLGTAMRATGDNPQMVRATGSNTSNMIVVGLGISNGLVGLAGALLAQYQGFADVQMGIGMIVWGMASVIMGEALVRSRRLGFAIVGALMGSILFRLLVAVALRAGLNPSDMKLITAAFVLCALVLPRLVAKRTLRPPWVKGPGGSSRKGVPSVA